MRVVFLSTVEKPGTWLPRLSAALPGAEFRAYPDLGDTATVDVALVATPPPGVVAALPNLKLVQSLWMGVDGLFADPTFPRHVPLARLIDPGMVAAMSESVLAHVLDLHRGLFRYREQQARREWRKHRQLRADERRVGILGLGVLGTDAARKLAALGYRVAGWSRRAKTVDGVTCLSGAAGLETLLGGSDVLVCLLPLTPETRGLLDRERLALLPRGASLVNLARGAHVVDADLLAALDGGRLSRAVLDVFENEPLPPAHPFWTHPRITLTPHVAALTDPVTSTPRIVENLERLREGRPLVDLVDRAAGY